MSYSKQEVYEFLRDGQSLEEADLSESKLIGIKLSKLNLKGISFEGADLCYAHLAGAILEEANLKGANMVGAKLSGANLCNANLEGAYLDNADLTKADLRGACLKNAKLTHASLRAAKIGKTDFTKADLRGVNLRGTKECLKAKFNDANLNGSHIDHTGLDKNELAEIGATVDNYAEGVRVRVFDFFKVEDEKRSILAILFIPFRWLALLIIALFRLLPWGRSE